MHVEFFILLPTIELVEQDSKLKKRYNSLAFVDKAGNLYTLYFKDEETELEFQLDMNDLIQICKQKTLSLTENKE